MLDREEVLSKAVKDCFREMFAKAQPAADWDNIIAEYKAGKIDEKKDGPVYDRHYLSHAEFEYILNKYLDAYRIRPEWEDDINILEDYLKNGGKKDKYIKDYTDEHGNHHPGYRSAEDVLPMKKYIYDIIYNEYDGNGEIADAVTEKVTNKVMELISNCKNFYCFNSDYQKFLNTICGGATPTSNKETVKKWWKDHYDVDIEIEDHNPLLFWEYEYYGDNIDEVMSEDYGANWQEYWWNKYNTEEAEKKARRDAELKKLQEEYEKKNTTDNV